MNELELIYDRLKDRFPLVLTNTLALDEGFTIDTAVLFGQNHLGAKMFLYKEEEDWDEFVFSEDFSEMENPILISGHPSTHGHPQSAEEAFEYTIKFMEGKEGFWY